MRSSHLPRIPSTPRMERQDNAASRLRRRWDERLDTFMRWLEADRDDGRTMAGLYRDPLSVDGAEGAGESTMTCEEALWQIALDEIHLDR